MDITRRSDISYEEFIEEHYKTGIPLIFTGAANAWNENNTLCPDWFKKVYPDKAVIRVGTTYHMKEIVDIVESGGEGNAALYPFEFSIPDQMPELTQWIRVLNPGYALQDWADNKIFSLDKWAGATELSIEGVVCNSSDPQLDYRHSDTWTAQLYGEKQFTVFPDGQNELLYPSAENPYRSEINIFEPDLKRYPKYRNAKSISFVLSPGETVFIPAGSWYFARSITPSISVGFNASNSKSQKQSIKKLKPFKSTRSKLKSATADSYAWIVAQSNKISARFRQKAF